MKYNDTNKPYVCMMTQSTCYKGTRTMTPVGVLWHSTGANNPTLKRYVQPSNTPDSRDTITVAQIGKNAYNNDWNHIDREAGLNCWIGKLADGTVTTVQTMPWNYRPWGCGSGNKGSCNSGWIQFEICEDGLTDSTYFNAVYKEACEITAYLCKMFGINPHGTVTVNGVSVPTILCHQDSYKYGMGSNHSDIYNWFPKHGKSMETARNDVAALMNATPSTPVTDEVKTYKVVTNVNKYTTSANAQAQTGSVGTLAAGTYYIYYKYPNGYNGMYNLTTDKTAQSAGSWINPKENAAPTTPTVTTKELYRVRKSKDDAKSQIGAYSILDNAKAACDKAGAGYKVFDSNYIVVYEYKAPEVVKPTEPTTPVTPQPTATSKKVYELDFLEKTPIIESITRINADCVKAIKAIKANNEAFDVNITKAFFSIAPKYKIDPMKAIAQSILETGWFKFAGSSVKPEQHNYCGLGATGGGVAGASFDTVEKGVEAQLQHLFAYGCKDAVPVSEDNIYDLRFKYVTRGIAPYWQQLAGRWAVPGFDGNDAETAIKNGATYGQKIMTLYNKLVNTEVTEEEVKIYFSENIKPDPAQPEPVTPQPTTPESKPEDTTDSLVKRIVDIIIKVIKALLHLE